MSPYTFDKSAKSTIRQGWTQLNGRAIAEATFTWHYSPGLSSVPVSLGEDSEALSDS
jgi:hypothetical protein